MTFADATGRARLLVTDVDSTLITQEVIELLAEHAGVREEVAAITDAAMRGELDFAASLAARVATLNGLPASVIDEVAAKVEYTPGARELVLTLQKKGWDVALVSGGFAEIVSGLAEDLGVNLFRANRLEVEDGHLTGRTLGPVIDREAKAEALLEFAALVGADPADTVALGDGANDIGMFGVAGVSIAFNAKPAVRKVADLVIEGPRLDAVLDLLGLHGEALEGAQ